MFTFSPVWRCRHIRFTCTHSSKIFGSTTSLLPAWGEVPQWSQNPGSSQPRGHAGSMPSSHWTGFPVPVHLSPWRIRAPGTSGLCPVGSPSHMLKLPWYSLHTASWQGSRAHHKAAAIQYLENGVAHPSEPAPVWKDTVTSLTRVTETVQCAPPSVSLQLLSTTTQKSTFFNVLRSSIVSIFQYISNKMQRYTVYWYLETALHVLGGISTHHQEHTQLLSTVSGTCQTVTTTCCYCWRVGTLPQ